MSTESSANLWSSLLKESSKRSKLPDSTCVFVGDKSVGKNAIIEKICAQTESTDAVGRIKDLISYNYIDLDDGSSDAELMARINVWSFSSRTFNDCFEHVLRPKKGDRVVFIIGVDASQPDSCLASVKSWLKKVKRYSQSFQGGDSSSSTKVGFPVIIAACKSDTVKSEDTATLKRAKEVQGQLRSLSLSVGCSLIYTSAVGDINCALLKKYISHTLFPENVPMDLALEDGANSAFIPVGFDSPELISIATSITPQVMEAVMGNLSFLDDVDVDWDTQVGEVQGKDKVAPVAAPIEIEDEDEWLAGLQNYISQAAGGSSSSSATATPGDTTQHISSSSSERPPAAAVPASESTKGGMHLRKRSAPVTAAAEDNKQEVDNFFKNLLAAPPKK